MELGYPYQDRVPQDAALERAMDGDLLRVLIGISRFRGRI